MSLTYTIYEGKVLCYEGTPNNCNVVFLAEPEMSMGFHGDGLAEATKEINAILQRVADSEEAEGRELRLLSTPSGLMLAWANCGEVVTASSEPDKLSRALGLKA